MKDPPIDASPLSNHTLITFILGKIAYRFKHAERVIIEFRLPRVIKTFKDLQYFVNPFYTDAYY
ncbi:MAG: hypothetical protein F7B17_05375 [Desulfurococcales archaeon]|nr:hypothetical protein [Desulfurococcales archaeon]